MRIQSGFEGARRIVLTHLCGRTVDIVGLGPLVSLTFDDFPRTAWTIGGAILRNLGVRGTYYVALSLMDSCNALGEQFHLEDLLSLTDAGNELATHTYSHLSGRKAPPSKFLEDVLKGYSAIKELGNLTVTRNFAYPFGDVTLRAKLAVGREMGSCRGIHGGLNGPMVDLNLLRANRLYGDIGGLAHVRRLIEQNQRRRGWLIFYTHDVRDHPSRYGCTPELLERTIELAISNGMKILRVDDVLRMMATSTTQSIAHVEI